MALVLQRRTFAYVATPQGGSGAMTSEIIRAINNAEADANAFLAGMNFNDVVQVDLTISPIGTEETNAVACVTVTYLVNM